MHISVCGQYGSRGGSVLVNGPLKKHDPRWFGSRSNQDREARHTAALVIAKVAAIELPRSSWPDLISTLLGNMGLTPPNSGLRQATLESLGCVAGCARGGGKGAAARCWGTSAGKGLSRLSASSLGCGRTTLHTTH